MANYSVVLFKNKKKKKIINKFITPQKAHLLYKKLMKESQEVIFETQVESGSDCSYELGIVHMSSEQKEPVYLTDELGRFQRVRLDEKGMTLILIEPYKKEEYLYDLQENKKINLNYFVKTYLKGDGIKMVSTLNNKVVVQDDDKFSLFTVKSENESLRFVECMSSYFHKIKRGDCLFIKDTSTPQRKYLYALLESKGFDKKVLYRKFTSLPQ
jgi:hypothetical protein